jgi:hypothetical protein
MALRHTSSIRVNISLATKAVLRAGIPRLRPRTSRSAPMRARWATQPMHHKKSTLASAAAGARNYNITCRGITSQQEQEPGLNACGSKHVHPHRVMEGNTCCSFKTLISQAELQSHEMGLETGTVIYNIFTHRSCPSRPWGSRGATRCQCMRAAAGVAARSQAADQGQSMMKTAPLTGETTSCMLQPLRPQNEK